MTRFPSTSNSFCLSQGSAADRLHTVSGWAKSQIALGVFAKARAANLGLPCGPQALYADIHKTLECIEIIDELAPKPEDFVIDKLGYGAFHDTRLDDTLRQRGSSRSSSQAP